MEIRKSDFSSRLSRRENTIF